MILSQKAKPSQKYVTMKRIVILDTWVSSSNLGNKIIMEAVSKNLRELFPHDFFYQVPALEYLQARRELVKQADYVFLAGANLLSSDMNKTSQWRLRITDIFWMRGIILMGVGWWQWQQYPPNLYTRFLLRRVLERECYHSVRDSYTADKLGKAFPFLKVLNTGCPTVWELNKKHCDAIPHSKAKSVLLTFTEYSQRPKDDRLLFEIVRSNYTTIYCWPEMYGDYQYAKNICDSDVVFVDPSVESLDDLLEGEDIDYVGTRLHAGIRALQHRRRTIVVAVDNRAIEMGRDLNLPIVPRKKVAIELEDKISRSWATEVNLDQQAIATWKQQFAGSINHVV